MAIKLGDRVRFLNSVGGGIVKKIDGKLAYVEDEDGFSTPALIKELVVICEAGKETTAKPVKNISLTDSIAQATHLAETKPEDIIELPPFEETPEGESLNVVLAFVPKNIKSLSTTGWEIYLINDSNYWLQFVFSIHGRGESLWNLINSNQVEPGVQLFIKDIESGDLNNFEHLLFQIIAFKRNKAYSVKQTYNIEDKLDITKFFKLHCYKPDIYFEEETISVALIKDDKPLSKLKESVVKELEDSLKAKKSHDLRPTVKRIRKRSIENDPMAPLIVDLHIEELIDNTRGMSAADILNRQIDEFRSVMDKFRNHKGKKIIFIHGKGEGVLRNAILKELNHRYKGNDVQDASFREYGFGATQVLIR